jgi:hypothetical protein
MGIGDWGLGIGPIPNPQSPIPNPQSSKSKYTLSGDDMNSNMSFDSGCMSYRRTITLPAGSDLEKEIDFEHSSNYSTPKKNSSYVRNYYYNNETNNNFSSERVICDELSSARKKMSAENK